MQLSVSLCRAASTLQPFRMTYIPLFYVVRPNISDYANMLIRPSGMMPSISLILSTTVSHAWEYRFRLHCILTWLYIKQNTFHFWTNSVGGNLITLRMTDKKVLVGSRYIKKEDCHFITEVWCCNNKKYERHVENRKRVNVLVEIPLLEQKTSSVGGYAHGDPLQWPYIAIRRTYRTYAIHPTSSVSSRIQIDKSSPFG
jgi:hypothetical protein